MILENKIITVTKETNYYRENMAEYTQGLDQDDLVEEQENFLKDMGFDVTVKGIKTNGVITHVEYTGLEADIHSVVQMHDEIEKDFV